MKPCFRTAVVDADCSHTNTTRCLSKNGAPQHSYPFYPTRELRSLSESKNTATTIWNPAGYSANISFLTTRHSTSVYLQRADRQTMRKAPLLESNIRPAVPTAECEWLTLGLIIHLPHFSRTL